MSASAETANWLSGEVYSRGPGDNKTSYTAPDGTTWLLDRAVDNDETGFAAAIYHNAKGEVIVVFRGTEPGRDPEQDIYTDAMLGKQASNAQYDSMVRFLDESKGLNLLGGSSVTFVGHSLGGNLAMHATIMGDRWGLGGADCITYNAPGFCDEYMKEHGLSEGSYGRIIEYRTTGDLVSAVGHHPGKVIFIEDTGLDPNLHHDWRCFKFVDGQLVLNVQQQPDGGWPAIVAGLTQYLDAKIPPKSGGAVDLMARVILWICFSNPDGMKSFIAGLIQFFQNPVTIVIFGPAAIVITSVLVITAVVVLKVAVVIDEVLLALDDAIELSKYLAKEAIKLINSAVAWGIAAKVLIADVVRSFVDGVVKEVKNICAKIGGWLKGFLGHAGNIARQAGDRIIACASELDGIATLLRSAQKDLMRADALLNQLVPLVKLEQMPQVIWADWRTGYSFRAGLSAAYVQNTASSLRQTEDRIAALAAKLNR